MKIPKILVVDDMSDIRAIVHRILTAEGYEVKLAVSAREAIKFLSEDSEIELVLLDISMPEVDGFHTFKAIQALRAQRPVKISFLTGKRDKSHLLKSIELKADDYILKPIDPHVLKAKVRQLLGRDGKGDSILLTNIHWKATLVNAPVAHIFHVSGLNEFIVELESTLAFNVGGSLTFHCPELNKIIGHEYDFTARVSRCEARDKSYFVRATLTGVPPAVLQKLRDLSLPS